MFPLGSQPTSSKKCGREECRLMRQENVSLKQKIKELEKLNGQNPFIVNDDNFYI